METIPVYLFVGFLEAGKTRFIQETMEDTRFHKGEKTLILLCEEGDEELDPAKYTGGHVTIETLDDEEDLTREKLEGFYKKYGFERVVLEYNGMWPMARLMEQMPENWQIYQCMMMADANTFLSYNQNMRGLMVDKLQLCELCVLNRASDKVDKEAIHKVIRGVSRRTDIAYEYPNGDVEYDETEDPLPFDLNAPIIEIQDRDFALWYRDASEEPKKYQGKTVQFTAMVCKSKKLPKGTFIPGRFVMTCCVQDITFMGFMCQYPPCESLEQRSWIRVTARIDVKFSPIYRGRGPILQAIRIEPGQAPEQEVATFY
ncbi:MAG: TIGR03943 family putative permease subunit [Acutalibacteraceae bacterium]